MTALLRVEGVHYRYRRSLPWALTGVDLTVSPGEYVVVAGASGSGKSTLVRLCNGLIPHLYPGEMVGRVWVAGLDTRTWPVHEFIVHVGMAFQNPEAQIFTTSVYREIAFGLESLGLDPATIRRRVEETAAFLGIEALLPRQPQNLSGGEQQLVVMAAALALQPELLVVDEPFAHLDAVSAARVREALRRVHQAGVAVLVVEHHLRHVLADATRLVVLHKGRVVLDGPPREVLREDLSAYGVVEPPAVQWARRLGWDDVPLTDEEFRRLIGRDGRGHRLLPRPTPQRASREEILRVEGLTAARDGRIVLEGVAFAVHRGECVAVVGANGAGKTTLIRHLNGLLRPVSGRVLVLGQDVARAAVSTMARHVGMSFQNPAAQFFKPTVRAELEVGPRVLGRWDPAWIEDVARRFRLHGLLERSPFTLSEGEKRRLGFAIALAARPEIVVLDEPTAGQDAWTRQALLEFVRELREEGRTLIVVTHDLDFAEACADRWLVLGNGRLLADGPPDEVMADEAVMAQARLMPTVGHFVRRFLAVETAGEEQR